MDRKLFTCLCMILLIAVFSYAILFWLGDPTAMRVQASPVQIDSVFGVEVAPAISSAYGLDWIVPPEPDTQTHWVRTVSVDWSQVEPNPGDRVWSGLDAALVELQNAVDNGLTPTIMVRGVPTWARPPETVGYLCSPIAESEFGAFANFIDDVMTDPDSPLRDFDLTYWEFFNEPEILPEDVDTNLWWGDCWGDKDEEYFGGEYYVRMLQEVHPVIKGNDPGAQVLVGGLMLDCDPNNPPDGKDCNASKFLEGILVNGGSNDGGDFFDGVSFHSYDYYFDQLGAYGNGNWHTAWNTTGPSITAKAGYIQELLAEYGYGDKFLMNTESALLFCKGCSPDPIYETTKAYYLAQAYATAIAEGLRANFWFELRGDWEDRLTGLLTKDTLEPLPAYYAYRFASQILEGAVYLQDINVYRGVTGYAFDSGDRIVSVVWSRDGEDHDITLPGVPSAIYEVEGTPRTPAIDVTVGLMPLYIETQESINKGYIRLPLIFNKYSSFTNGDFEQGDNGWTLENYGLPAQVITSSQGETIGSRSLLLGNQDYPCEGVPIGYAKASQAFVVPKVPDGVSIELNFKYVIYTQDTSYDIFEVYINDQSPPVFSDRNFSNKNLSCETWFRIPGPDNSRNGRRDGWAAGSVDLSSYRGELITVSFQNHNTTDNIYNTYTYLDDVDIVIGD